MMIILLLTIMLAPLPPQKFTIVGTVRDTGGRSVPGVRVLVRDENFQPIRTIFVDSSGQFFVRGLGPGRYQFRVETTGTPYEERETGWIELQALRVRSGGSEQYPLDIVLKLKAEKRSVQPMTSTVFIQDVPDAARLAYDEALKSRKEGATEATIASLIKAIAIFPDYFEALELLGTEYVRTGQYEPALEILLRALAVNERAARSLYAVGVVFLKSNHFAEAIQYLKKADVYAPDNANTQMMLGLAYGYNQQSDASEAAFKKALQLGGEAVAEAHFYLAGLYDKQQRYREAAQELELYLQTAKDIQNPTLIRSMIEKLDKKADGRKGRDQLMRH